MLDFLFGKPKEDKGLLIVLETVKILLLNTSKQLDKKKQGEISMKELEASVEPFMLVIKNKTLQSLLSSSSDPMRKQVSILFKKMSDDYEEILKGKNE